MWKIVLHEKKKQSKFSTPSYTFTKKQCQNATRFLKETLRAKCKNLLKKICYYCNSFFVKIVLLRDETWSAVTHRMLWRIMQRSQHLEKCVVSTNVHSECGRRTLGHQTHGTNMHIQVPRLITNDWAKFTAVPAKVSVPFIRCGIQLHPIAKAGKYFNSRVVESKLQFNLTAVTGSIS